VLQLLKRRAWNEKASEMREHPEAIRYALLGCFLHVRSMEVLDDVVRMAIDIVHRVDTQSFDPNWRYCLWHSNRPRDPLAFSALYAARLRRPLNYALTMAAAEPGTVAVLAEKPSVARDIAKVLGAGNKGDGYLHGNAYVVTWAIGHLAALAQPHEIHPEWKQWRRQSLPMLPREWPLVVYEKTRDQFETVKRILTSAKVSRVVCATDAGREGELIFRYIYEAAGCGKPVSRLWISSLTPDAIRRGFETLRPGADYDSLADAARGRSRADWLVGMNLSRAYSLTYGEDLSVGRVQTPTLALLVEREAAIRGFVPEDYMEVAATFHPQGLPADQTYQGTWLRDRAAAGADKESLQQAMRLPADGEEAGQIAERARTGQAAIESIEAKTQRMPPPLLYDLTELQRHANRLFGFSAQKTLDTAQSLYEKYKLISYPRTDSRHLSQDVAKTLPRVVTSIKGPYSELKSMPNRMRNHRRKQPGRPSVGTWEFRVSYRWLLVRANFRMPTIHPECCHIRGSSYCVKLTEYLCLPPGPSQHLRLRSLRSKEFHQRRCTHGELM
jgi:hypothetical protein